MEISDHIMCLHYLVLILPNSMKQDQAIGKDFFIYETFHFIQKAKMWKETDIKFVLPYMQKAPSVVTLSVSLALHLDYFKQWIGSF